MCREFAKLANISLTNYSWPRHDWASGQAYLTRKDITPGQEQVSWIIMAEATAGGNSASSYIYTQVNSAPYSEPTSAVTVLRARGVVSVPCSKTTTPADFCCNVNGHSADMTDVFQPQIGILSVKVKKLIHLYSIDNQ